MWHRHDALLFLLYLDITKLIIIHTNLLIQVWKHSHDALKTFWSLDSDRISYISSFKVQYIKQESNSLKQFWWIKLNIAQSKGEFYVGKWIWFFFSFLNSLRLHLFHCKRFLFFLYIYFGVFDAIKKKNIG